MSELRYRAQGRDTAKVSTSFRSTLLYFPATDVTVVVLANDSTANTADLAELLRQAAGSD